MKIKAELINEIYELAEKHGYSIAGLEIRGDWSNFSLVTKESEERERAEKALYQGGNLQAASVSKY